MKKILYYLSNIVLGIYLILYPYIFVNQMRDYEEKRLEGMLHYGGLTDEMNKISLCVIILAIILRVIFSSKKFNLKELEKKISTIMFVIEIIMILFIVNVFAFG